MVASRVLAIAPLAVLVALAAHVTAFGADHAFGGAHSGELLALAIGGFSLLALVGTVWTGVAAGDVQEGEAVLWRALPIPGRGGIWATLLVTGFAAFACGELLEGRSPLGTWVSALALLLAAGALSFAARHMIRWLAAGGAALRSLIERARYAAARPVVLVRPSSPVGAPRVLSRGTCRGRAPPLFA
jgi:hypothetical protein